MSWQDEFMYKRPKSGTAAKPAQRKGRKSSVVPKLVDTKPETKTGNLTPTSTGQSEGSEVKSHKVVVSPLVQNSPGALVLRAVGLPAVVRPIPSRYYTAWGVSTGLGWGLIYFAVHLYHL